MNATRRIIKRSEACYETKEVPFGRIYEWHPAYIVLECSCGETLTLTKTTSTKILCRRCSTENSHLLQNILEQEEAAEEEVRLPDEEVRHPWFYDVKARGEQHLRDEAVYPEDSPWRYNDVTAGNSGSTHEEGRERGS